MYQEQYRPTIPLVEVPTGARLESSKLYTRAAFERPFTIERSQIMPLCQINYFYGVEYINENGKKRSSRVFASSIGAGRKLGKCMEQAGEELFAIWLLG